MYLTSIFEASGGEDLIPTILFVCSFGLATSVLLKSRWKDCYSDAGLLAQNLLERQKNT